MTVSTRLEHLCDLSRDEATAELLRCCGSTTWANLVADARPFGSEVELDQAAARAFDALKREDWLDAFAAHPRIGDRARGWEAHEQAGVASAQQQTLERLAERNAEYEQRFGHVYLICASGRSADEMLTALEARIDNDPETELTNAAHEQRAITKLRLQKWLSE